MAYTSKLLVAAGLAGILITGLGAGPASAQDSPVELSPRASGGSSEDVRVVPDAGRSAGRRIDSAASLQSCYGGAKAWDAGLDDPDGDSRYIPGQDDRPDSAVGRVPVYVASSRCNDINLRVTGGWTEGLQVRACFFPSSSSYYCNSWKPVPADGVWMLPATGVRDGTRFEIEFDNPGGYVQGAIAY
jgi:hypothetical protein